jgi:hypothetical protein
VSGPVEPWRPTIARWINRKRRAKGINGEQADRWSKVLAHQGPLSQFTYGSNTASDWQGRRTQLALICTRQTGTIAVDVDFEGQYQATRTARLIGRQAAFTTRGERFHVVIDARFVPEQDWPRQGPITGADIKSNGWIPVPGSEHYSGELYQPAREPPVIVPAWPELIAAINADRADHHASSTREGNGNGHGGGEHSGGHDDRLTGVVFAATMDGLRAGLTIGDPWLEQAVYAKWWAEANPPEDPSDPYLPENWPRFWCQRLWDKATAEFAAERQAYQGFVQGTVPGAQQPPTPAHRPPPGLPPIDCGQGRGPEVIRALTAALNDGTVPWTWVTDGRVVILERVTGSPDMVTAEGNRPLPVAVSQASPAGMASLLAHTTYTFRWETIGKNTAERREFTPEAGTLAGVLKPRNWPGLPVLNGIIGSPVLRPDGTLLTAQGYDEATGLYLASRVDLPQIPVHPDAKLVAWARDTVLGKLLADFPWASPADKANYLAMLVTQVIRRWLRGAPVPLAMITATEASSGKTLLATIPGTLFGYVSVTWTDDETELRKQLTTVMLDQAGVIGFDNVPRGTVVRSATLSKLLTDRTWGDRLLGGNVLGRFANDRLWVVTGNNLRIGGDNRTRTVLVRLEPREAHPERRSGFVIPDLEAWIEKPANQRIVLTALLVLVADWAAAGCPLADVVPMRQFTSWARAAGGLLEHHGVEGFLGNSGELEVMDDDAADWAEFLARWHAIFGTASATADQLCKTQYDDRWGGTFPTGKAGQAITAKGLGRRLAGIRGSHHGGFTVRSQDGHASTTWWRVEKSG